MTDENFLTPEERLAKLSDTLLSSVLKDDAVSAVNRKYLFSSASPKVFRDENYIIYKVLYSYKEVGILPDAGFMELYLSNNEKLVRNSTEYIDITAYSGDDESPTLAYIAAVMKQFNRLLTIPTLDNEQYKLAVEKYKIEFQHTLLGDALDTAKTILYEGARIGKSMMSGYADAVAYVKKVNADIESVINQTSGVGFIDASVAGMIDDDNEKAEKIGDFGAISELNKYLGGIYSPYFYSIVAPTKGGKSKFTTRMIHNIVVEHKNNVVVWAHEGGHNAWLAQLRAIHYDYFYNRNEVDITKHKGGVSQDIILKDAFKSDAIRELERVSRCDLFSPSHGNIQLIDRPFNVETFIDEIDTAVQLNHAKAVLIDYIQLIGTIVQGKPKSQVVGEAYKRLLAYAKKRKVAIISPAQMTQAFMDELAKSKGGSTPELRTSGGESAEVIRTPDINIALYGSIDDIRAGSMQLLSIPSRMAQPYPPIDLYCNLATCVFASINITDD